MLIMLIWILALTVIILIVLNIKARRRHEFQTAAATAQHALVRNQLVKEGQERERLLNSEHEIALEKFDLERANERADLEARNDKLNKKLGDAHGLLRQGMKWELGSRRAIVGVCQRLQISGFLATNVIFEAAPPPSNGDRFVAQIDHVLVTDSFVLIIENKRWKGLVVSDKLPHEINPAFSHLISNFGLGDHFAVQIAPGSGSESTLAVRTRTATSAPCTQVRNQARQLSAYVASELGVKPWINTCVFYSHEGFHFEGPLKCTGSKGVTTAIAAGVERLRATIQGLMEVSNARPNPTQTTELGALCSKLGADVIGFGTYEERWGKSLVPTS